MSTRDAMELIDELDQLGVIVRVEDDEHLLETLEEIGVSDD